MALHPIGRLARDTEKNCRKNPVDPYFVQLAWDDIEAEF